MPKYGISFQGFATTTSLKTILKMTTVTIHPIEMVELILSGAGATAAADTQHEGHCGFLTAAGAGTGTAQTPELFDTRSSAANSTATVNFSAEPTTYNTVSPLQFGFNQRGGFRFSVPRGEGLMAQLESTAKHIGARLKSSAAGAVDGNAHFWEW